MKQQKASTSLDFDQEAIERHAVYLNNKILFDMIKPHINAFIENKLCELAKENNLKVNLTNAVAVDSNGKVIKY